MIKLLRANFARLLKNKTFHICMFIMFGFAAAVLFASSSDKSFVALDGLLFLGSIFVGIAISVFVGNFIGTEYSDGTLRSKLTSGHSRITVYLANLISCTAAALMLHLIYIAVIICAGTPLLGRLEMPIDMILMFLSCSIVTMCAFAAIFMLISMLVPIKSSGLTLTIIASMLILVLSFTIRSSLDNPEYLSETKLRIFKFLYDFMPSGQIFQIAGTNIVPDNIERFPLYSLLIIAVTTAVGILLFRRKDLK